MTPRLRLPQTIALAGLALVAACSRAPERVAALHVAPATLQLPFPGFETVRIEITPRAELPPGSEPQLFLHLLDEPGSVARTFDLPLPEGWSVGRPIRLAARVYQSALADPLDAGSYVLTAGLYDRNGARFALETAGRELSRLEYAVANVNVPVAGGALPGLRFSDGWLPAVPGQDRQILARRSLEGQGPATFQIGPLEGPGQLLLRIAPAPLSNGRAEIDSGADSARVRVRSSCGGYEAELPGDVAVETLLEVPATDGELECDVELAPNFFVRSARDGQPRSIALELLAWHQGAAEPSDE